MQASPSHAQRQLVSGKVGWGWRQATHPISLNFGFAGFWILIGAIAQLLKLSDPNYLLFALMSSSVLFAFGLLCGIYLAGAVVEACQQNAEYRFSQWHLIGTATYWLALIAILNLASESLVKSFVALWWILPAAIFLGVSISVLSRSTKLKSKKLTSTNSPQPANQPAMSVNTDLKSQHLNADNLNADFLNIVTYSDRTILVSPSSLSQQPRQFNSIVLIVFGLFFWTMIDLPNSVKAIATIAFTITGITGFFTWQLQLRSPEKILELRFSGLWGIAAEYAIDLRPFSLLSIVKLQESSGELSWMNLAGGNSQITMPLAMTTLLQTKQAQPNQAKIKQANTNQTQANQAPSADQSDGLGQILRDEFHLAKQETELDSMGLANVLIPQGAGILAGIAFIAAGTLLLFLLPLPANLASGNAIAWLGVCLTSPAIARFILQLVAPSCLQCDRPKLANNIQSWEIGTAILLISIFLSTQSAERVVSLVRFNQVLPLLTLICGWMSISIGVCLFAFVRRTPLWTINY